MRFGGEMFIFWICICKSPLICGSVHIYSDDLQMHRQCTWIITQSFKAQLCTYEWCFAYLNDIMWMSIRSLICHSLWICLFICHSKSEKIKAEIKGSSDQRSPKTFNGSFPHHRGKALRHLNYILNFTEYTTW